MLIDVVVTKEVIAANNMLLYLEGFITLGVEVFQASDLKSSFPWDP